MAEIITAYKCQECSAISEETAGPLYECGDCGTKFNRDNSADGSSHRCPDCNKFAGKVADQSCAECEEGEVEELEAYQSEDGELFETEQEAQEQEAEKKASPKEALVIGDRVMFQASTAHQQQSTNITLRQLRGSEAQLSIPHLDRPSEQVSWWVKTKTLVKYKEPAPAPAETEAQIRHRDTEKQLLSDALDTLVKRKEAL